MADLTTKDAVKAYIGKTDPADDTLITSMVTAYSEWVRSYTNRDFTVQAYSIWRSGRGGKFLPVPQWPIVSVSSLSIDGVAIPAQSSFGAYGYRFTDNLVVVDGTIFSPGVSNINLVFTAGFATVPADIAQAVNELVALRYKLRDKMEWSSKALAGETVTLITKDMPSSVSTVLNQYVNPVPL